MTAQPIGRTPVADAVAPPETGPGRRRRAWLRAGCVLLAVAVYLSLWTAYALNGLTSHGRYRQYAAGAPVDAMGAEFRLVSLVQTTQLTNSITGEITSPPVNAVFLVARVDVVRRSDDPDLFCSFAILGPESADLGAEHRLRVARSQQQLPARGDDHRAALAARGDLPGARALRRASWPGSRSTTRSRGPSGRC